MITEIKFGKIYTPPNGAYPVIFHSVNEKGLYNYSVEGIRTIFPLFCTLQEALDMVNGNSLKWKEHPNG